MFRGPPKNMVREPSKLEPSKSMFGGPSKSMVHGPSKNDGTSVMEMAVAPTIRRYGLHGNGGPPLFGGTATENGG